MLPPIYLQVVVASVLQRLMEHSHLLLLDFLMNVLVWMQFEHCLLYDGLSQALLELVLALFITPLYRVADCHLCHAQSLLVIYARCGRLWLAEGRCVVEELRGVLGLQQLLPVALWNISLSYHAGIPPLSG